MTVEPWSPEAQLADLRETLDDLVTGIVAEEALSDASSGVALIGIDWVRSLSDPMLGNHRGPLTNITALARTMAVANPLIRRGLALRAAYVWGGGVTVTARDDGSDGGQDVQAVVEAFLDTPGNCLIDDIGDPINERSLGTDGQVFFALFTNQGTGAVDVRKLAWDEVTEVVTNPEDRSEPWYYLREWTRVEVTVEGRINSTMQRAYYPAVGYDPASKPRALQTAGHDPVPVYWDAPVHHVSVNRLEGWQFGIGDSFTGLDWARAYSVFLEDWAKLVKALSQFAWRTTSKGSKVTSIAAKIAAAGAANAVGSTVNTTSDTGLEAIPKTGATIDSDSGRPLAAMVAAALDVPVTMLLGDPGVTGARATAETLDKPTELMANGRRHVWTEAILTILDYVIDQAIKAPAGPLRGTAKIDPYTGRKSYELAGGATRVVDVVWPPLEETDPSVLIKAISDADALGVVPKLIIARLALQALGVDDVQDILDDLTDPVTGDFQPPADALGQAAADAFRAGRTAVSAVGSAGPEQPPPESPPAGAPPVV